MTKIKSNSGVEGGSGYSFQRCCIIFLLFKNYEQINSKNYFICLEHHDDFLFAFLDNNKQLQKVDTYQAKKSRDDWTVTNAFGEIVRKITIVGKELTLDPTSKSNDYAHTLNFITNRNILLKNKGVKQDNIKVQISNPYQKYSELPDKIKENIESKICKSLFEKAQLEYVNFQYIDFAQSYPSWKRQLIGMSTEHFKDKISDHSAAVVTLLQLLEDVAQTYNDNNKVLLSDTAKRVTKKQVINTFKILTDNKKSFDFWRQYAKELSNKLDLKLPIQRKAKEYLENCFDYFKDIQQVEFNKIYKFVQESTHIDISHNNEVDCIKDLYDLYNKTHNSKLENYMVSFAIIAAYVETREIDG